MWVSHVLLCMGISVWEFSGTLKSQFASRFPTEFFGLSVSRTVSCPDYMKKEKLPHILWTCAFLGPTWHFSVPLGLPAGTCTLAPSSPPHLSPALWVRGVTVMVLSLAGTKKAKHGYGDPNPTTHLWKWPVEKMVKWESFLGILWN